ncbi:MAG: DUF2057 family protein [Alcanivoracaceae bacterium]
MRLPILLLICLLTACSSNPNIRLYDGAELSADQLLVVEVPSRLEIVSINERKVDGVNRMFTMEDRALQLLPGEYRIVAFYKDVFDMAPSGHQVVRSDLTEFRVAGVAGSRHRLDFEAPATLDEARVMARNFTGYSIDLSSGERRNSEPSGLVNQGLLGITAASATVSHATVAPLPAAGQQTESLDQLDLLKAGWRTATAEERRAFLRWIAEQGD